jgi:hypothetical protein
MKEHLKSKVGSLSKQIKELRQHVINMTIFKSSQG